MRARRPCVMRPYCSANAAVPPVGASAGHGGPEPAELRRDAVLVVGHVLATRHRLHPRHRAAGRVVLLHGDVGHEVVGGGAVPVVLAPLEEDAVAGPDDLDAAARALAAPDALGH